jgi:hypothetical protein
MKKKKLSAEKAKVAPALLTAITEAPTFLLSK